MDDNEDGTRHVVGGVDTHKDLHVAAVVDGQDRFWELPASPPPVRGIGRCSSGCARSGTSGASALNRPAATVPAYSASCKRLALTCWRLLRLTGTIAGDVARMMTSMPRMPPMLPSREGELSRPEAETGW